MLHVLSTQSDDRHPRFKRRVSSKGTCSFCGFAASTHIEVWFHVFLKETTTPVDVHDAAERWKSHGAMQGTSPTLWVRSVEVGKRKGVEFIDEDQ